MAVVTKTVERRECDRCSKSIGARQAKALDDGAGTEAERTMFFYAREGGLPEADEKLPDLCDLCLTAVRGLSGRIANPTKRTRKDKVKEAKKNKKA